MAELENSELTSSHGSITVTPICRITINEKELKANRKDLLQLKILKRNHKTDRRGRDAVPLEWATNKWRIITIAMVLPKKQEV